jgi:potassium/chloride transporter 4/5/6
LEESDDSVGLRLGIPGLSSPVPISHNYKASFLGEGEFKTDKKGVKNVEVLGSEATNFLILLGIFFPSVTGIMAGANRSGDLKDPSRSIPKGTLCAVTITGFIYLSNVILFGTCIDGLLLRDKFGDSINKQLIVGILAWPNKWIVTIGAFLSTFGAGLQTLTSAPRLLQAIAKDDVIPFLKPLAVSTRGEPLRALAVTLCLVECGILLGNVDYLTPLIAMFFLMCYGLVNFACALQTLLKAPSWRPRYKYYHWSLSLLGVILCLSIMFIIRWYYAIVAIVLGIFVYKYVEFKGAEKEWGDGLRGLSMSAARYALLNLQQSPPHVKNWRPQILLLLKCKESHDIHEAGKQLKDLRAQVSDMECHYDDIKDNNSLMNEQDQEFNIEVQHPKAFALIHQLKAGKGLIVCNTVIPGDFVKNKKKAKACKITLEKTMAQFKTKGFCEAIVSQNLEETISHMIQNTGLGGLKHNTVLLNWPDKLNKKFFDKKITDSFDEEESKLNLSTFVQTIRLVKTNESAIIIAKGIDSWPCNSKTDAQMDTIDLWWIISDGGLLLLIVFLLKKNKIWQNCKVRLFTVARSDENSIKIKNDLAQFLYFLRIEGEVDVIEMSDSEISPYTYEKTLKLHEREKLIKDLKIKSRKVENEPQIVIDRIRRSSIIKIPPGPQIIISQPENKDSSDANNNNNNINEEEEEEKNKVANQYTFSPSQSLRRPSLFQTETIRKMHSAVELNKKILEKSKNASLVLMNIPQPPKLQGPGDYNYTTYIHAATEGLNRVLLIRGSEREVVTIFS